MALEAFQVHLSVAFKFKSHSRLCEEFGKTAFEHMKDTMLARFKTSAKGSVTT